MSDERERAYWQVPVVTPERLDAWGRWKDNYLATCVDGWVAQSSPDRQSLIHAAAVVLLDLEAVDELPWMPLGVAMATCASAVLGTGPLEGDEKTQYVAAIRTRETAATQDETLALAYHMGITVQQASKMHRAATARFEPETPRSPEGRTALYRHFDEAGALLYIGIAREPEKRGEQHRYHSKWYRFVAATTTEWHQTRAAAHEAERAAIAAELPIFNQAHNKANRGADIDYLYASLESVSKPTAVSTGASA